jgi:hypothetical protein
MDWGCSGFMCKGVNGRQYVLLAEKGHFRDLEEKAEEGNFSIP